MDTLTAVLAVAVAALLVVAVVQYLRNKRAKAAFDGAMSRIGVDRPRRTSRPEALAAGLDRLDSYVAQAERDRTQLLSSMEHADIGILAVDDSGLVTFVNDRGQRYLGAKHGEAIAEVRLHEVLDEVIVSREPATQELDLYTPTRRVLRLRAVPVQHGVETLGAVLYIEDLTEQRRVDAIRREFVANVGHELKTPLGAMSILAETIVDTEEPEVRAKLAGRLSGEAKRMARLVEDLLDLARVESYGVPPEPVAVSELVSAAVGQVRAEAEELGVPLEIAPAPNGAAVTGDKRQLIAAVSNLLDNAVKFTKAKGDDQEGTVRLRAEAEPEWVAITVEDQGVGIPEGDLDRIFERFYRVDRTRSREGGGPGLGLSIVRHVALNHGGEVAVTSEEGKGSIFTLRLPRWVG